MSPSLGFVLNRSPAARRFRSALSSCESGRPRLSASRSIGEQTHIASDEPGPRPGKALHYRPSSTATQARPRQHETMNRHHPAPPVEKGNVEGMSHRQRVHIATAREHHDRRIRATAEASLKLPPIGPRTGPDRHPLPCKGAQTPFLRLPSSHRRIYLKNRAQRVAHPRAAECEP